MIAVRVPQPSDYETALHLLYQHLPPSEQQERVSEALAAIRRGELSPQGFLLAEFHAKPVGALLSAIQQDNTAFIWPPAVCINDHDKVNPPKVDDVADALLGELTTRLDEAGIWLGQCLLEPDDRVASDAMARNGFPHLTDLCYLERSAQTRFPSEPAARFGQVRYQPAINRERFAKLIEETYLGTLDCPELNGLRSASEALDSHRGSGEFDPARWSIYTVDADDVGVLLLNDHPEQQAWEIVYLGIAKRFRGRGYGRAMILQGCREAFAAGRASVLVAVDCRNTYAMQIYRDAGFVQIAVKSVHARIREKPDVRAEIGSQH